MKKLSLSVLTALLLVSAPNRASAVVIVPTGPFTGTMSEGWEEFPEFNGTYLPSPTTIMGGNAIIANDKLAVYPVGNAFLGTSGTAQVADGTKGLMLNYFAQTATITWNKPISAFGGFFGAYTIYNADPANVSVSFFGPSSSLIDTLSFTYSHSATDDGGLDWHGWSFDVPVYSVSLTGDFLAMDGLQAITFVPEPSGVTVVAIAALLVSFQRRAQRGQAAAAKCQDLL